MRKRTLDDLLSDSKVSLPKSEYSQHLARTYMVNMLRAAQVSRSIRSRLVEWFEHDDAIQELLDDRRCGQEEEERRLITVTIKYAVQVLEQKTSRPPALSPDASAILLVVKRFSLGSAAAALLELAHCYTHCNPVKDIWRVLSEGCYNPIEALTLILVRVHRDVEVGLRELAEVGIADWEAATRFRGHADPGDLINEFFWGVWHPPVRDMAELTARLVGKPCKARLGLDDFAHLDGPDDAIRLLRAAKHSRRDDLKALGVNILLVGRAGTGKTEFARTVAESAGMPLFSIGELQDDDDESCNSTYNSRAAYRNKLRMAQTLLRTIPDATILCDEAEDALESNSGSRLANHRLMEENPVPVIYTANSLKDLDESMLRRFTLVVRFTVHGPKRQTAILRRMLAESGIEGIDASTLSQRLVDNLECQPGILAKAIETTRLVGGAEDDLYRYCEGLERTIATQYARPRLGPPVRGELPWEAFSHLEKDAEDARETLVSVKDSEKKGINILLYGPPGTGKTEFARTLCADVGARLYAVGNKEVGPESRLAVSRTESLDFALEALANERGAVVFFDEMEDFDRVEKHWLNRVLEENPVPIIWACNSIDYYRMFQPFFIDRIMHAIEFRHMSVGARRRVFTGILSKEQIPEAEACRLAVDLAHDKKVTPRQVAMAAGQAGMVSGNAETIRRNIAQKAKLRHGIRLPEIRPIAQYDPALVCADVNLEDLTDRIVSLAARRFALCLYGPPGTGKTAYVGYIAERMGMDILPKRASDLLSPWVGQTEQKMAAAFAEALETGSFLVFDEVDSLLMDRQYAVRSWEMSMVNELLSQMERHPLPFACTTNRREALDPAAARRFLFRVEFFYMDRQRVERAFRFFYGCEAPLETLVLDKLTPADFANVREQAKLLSFLDDPERIARALAEECRLKPGGARLGF